MSLLPYMLFVSGKSGTGKTHFLHVLSEQEKVNLPSDMINITHCERFVLNIQKASKSGVSSEFINFLSSVDLLLIDDIGFLSGKYMAQALLIKVIKKLTNQRFVFTDTQQPGEIINIIPELKKSFLSSKKIQLSLPKYKERLAICKKYKNYYGVVHISDEIIRFIARQELTPREIQGIVRRIAFKSLNESKLITLDFANQCIDEYFSLIELQLSGS